MTDVLYHSGIVCLSQQLKLDLGGDPDFLSASFFLRGKFLISLMCCASVVALISVFGVRVNCRDLIPNSLCQPLESTAE